MRGRLLLLAILLVVGAAGLVASGTVKLPWNLAALDPVPSVPKPSAPESAHSKQDAKSVIEETTAALGLDGKDGADPADKPVLDVSRISRDGVSVFAGRAKPNSYVTLLEDGKPAGTAKTDDSGSFSLSTEHKFASLDPKLTFRTDANPPACPRPGADGFHRAREQSQGFRLADRRGDAEIRRARRGSARARKVGSRARQV